MKELKTDGIVLENGAFVPFTSIVALNTVTFKIFLIDKTVIQISEDSFPAVFDGYKEFLEITAGKHKIDLSPLVVEQVETAIKTTLGSVLAELFDSIEKQEKEVTKTLEAISSVVSKLKDVDLHSCQTSLEETIERTNKVATNIQSFLDDTY